MAAAAAVVIGAGAQLWIESSRSSLSSTNQLIAQAYTEQRTLELRFSGMPFGTLRRQRGGQDLQLENGPLALKDAEVHITDQLSRRPNDPGWLQAKARVDLLERNWLAAIDSIQRARTSRPHDSSLKIDLACAYFEQAGSNPEPDGYGLALDLLNQVLENDPTNLVARFDRAIVNGRAKKSVEAISDWNAYLRLDPSGEWATEARQRLNRLTTK